MRSQIALATVVGLIAMVPSGCRNRSYDTPALATSTQRASRRAFDGAPPVIPHKPMNANCKTCHTIFGKSVPNLGYAPANPHGENGNLKNCRQCHLFKTDEEVFAKSDFQGLRQTTSQGERSFPGAPPTIPHSLLMRSNCLACHSGPSVRPEIKCTHPDRANCRQCHLAQQLSFEN